MSQPLGFWSAQTVRRGLLLRWDIEMDEVFVNGGSVPEDRLYAVQNDDFQIAGGLVLLAGGARLEFVSVSPDGTYRLEYFSARRYQRPLPTFKNADGVNVSFDIAGLVLVRTRVSQQRPVSGAVPMLVLR